MMNLYRETEDVKIKKNVAKNVKLSIQTSPIYRLAMIKKVEKAIKKATAEDTTALKGIEKIINTNDLTDSQFGKTINAELLAKFNMMLEENELYSEQCAI